MTVHWRGIRAEDGVVHAFRERPGQLLRWQARCDARFWLGPDQEYWIDDPIDCMTCLIREARS